MAVQKQSKLLPEVLVEKIVATMPFTCLFKAWCRSKSWLAKFFLGDDSSSRRTMMAVEEQIKLLMEKLVEKVVATMRFPCSFKAWCLSKSWLTKFFRGDDSSATKTIMIMVVEEQNKFLPQELVEKIVAMMPFPYLFKARCLSKSWLIKFNRVSLLSDENDKVCASSFQKEVARWSHKWPTVYPFCQNTKDLIGYDQISRGWRTLPEFLLLLKPRGKFFVNPAPMKKKFEEIYMCNVLTGEHKLLETRPADGPEYLNCLKIVSDSSSGTYKLIISSQQGYGLDYGARIERGPGRAGIHVYDSKSKRWTANDFSMFINHATHYLSCAYLNGVLYLSRNYNVILAFNVEDVTMRAVVLTSITSFPPTCFPTLVNCNDNLVMIVVEEHYPQTVCVLRIDMKSWRMYEVARCVPGSFELKTLDTIDIPLSDTHCTFIKLNGVVVVYNQHKDEWSFFSFPIPEVFYGDRYEWNIVSFRPGLNPFMAV